MKISAATINSMRLNYIQPNKRSFSPNSLLKQKLLLLIAFCSIFISVKAQDLDPRLYANLPKKMNAAAIGYGLMSGNVVTDPSLPIQDFNITSHNIGIGYVRTFGLLNKLARLQVNLPYVIMDGNLKINGQDTSGSRSGFGDTRVRLGINLLGSPALDKKEFRKYQQETILGFSIITSIPTGLYYSDKRINIGSHRWAFKPELGISHRFKHVYAEAYAGVWLYTNNAEYMTNKLLVQQPVFSFQGHASYYFKNQMWVGVDANWFNGGETIVNGKTSGDLNDNWRMGGTWSVPITRSQSIKLQLNAGAFKNTGLNYNVYSLTYQYVFF